MNLAACRYLVINDSFPPICSYVNLGYGDDIDQ